jgi:hypothetical protein
MTLSRTRLEKQILAAFRTAHMDAQWDAAENLLSALEALPSDSLPGSSLVRAYALVARGFPRHRLIRGHRGSSDERNKIRRRTDV